MRTVARFIGFVGALACMAGLATAQSNNLHWCNDGDVIFIFSSPSPGTTWVFCDSTNDLVWKVYKGDTHLNHGTGGFGGTCTMEVDGFQESLFDTDWSTTPAFPTRSLGPAIADPICGEMYEPAFFQLGFTTEVCIGVGPSGFGNPCTVAPSLCSPTTGSCPPPGYVNGYILTLGFGSTPGTGIVITADGTAASDMAVTYFIDGGQSASSGAPGACGLGDMTLHDVHSWDESVADANTCATGASPWSGFQSGGSGPLQDSIVSIAESFPSFQEMTLEMTADSGAGTIGDGPFEGSFASVPGCGGAPNGNRHATVSGAGASRLSANVFDNGGNPASLYFLGGSAVGLFPCPGVTVLGGQMQIIPHGLTSALAGIFSGVAATAPSCPFGETNVVQWVQPRGGAEFAWIPLAPVAAQVTIFFQAVGIVPAFPLVASFSNVAPTTLYPL